MLANISFLITISISQCLSVHLENEQSIFFEVDDNIKDTINKNNRTTLTEWFENNKTCPEGNHLKYQDYSDMFVWNKSLKSWSKRKKDTSVSRMVFVSPNEGERYYLRMLLTHVSGATSFSVLRTINNIQYQTFKVACIAYDLLGDVNEFLLSKRSS